MTHSKPTIQRGERRCGGRKKPQKLLAKDCEYFGRQEEQVDPLFWTLGIGGEGGGVGAHVLDFVIVVGKAHVQFDR